MKYIVGQRVTHNFEFGHGDGTITEIVPGRWLYRPTNECPYTVQWDNGLKEIYNENDLRKASRKIVLARLDADGTAKPLTKIVGHSRNNWVQGPGITIPDTYRDEHGGNIPLKAEVVCTCDVILGLPHANPCARHG